LIAVEQGFAQRCDRRRLEADEQDADGEQRCAYQPRP